MLCYDSLSYRGKELPLGFNTAVVTSSGPRFHLKSEFHGIFHAEKSLAPGWGEGVSTSSPVNGSELQDGTSYHLETW